MCGEHERRSKLLIFIVFLYDLQFLLIIIDVSLEKSVPPKQSLTKSI